MQVQPHHRHPVRRRWVFAFLFAVAAGYAAYELKAVPWMNECTLAGITAQINAGEKTRSENLKDKKHQQQQTVAQLLKEAEAHFAVKRYLTPVHQNAYSVYQAVLALEPKNETALKRIEQIRRYYRTEGDTHFKVGDWSKALTYLERYTLIDPDAMDVRDKIATCHRKLGRDHCKRRRRYPLTTERSKRRRARRRRKRSASC